MPKKAVCPEIADAQVVEKTASGVARATVEERKACYCQERNGKHTKNKTILVSSSLLI